MRISDWSSDVCSSDLAASERLASISKELDELKARAILEPSEENVTAYIRFQREQLDRASMFSDVWQRSMWQNPDLRSEEHTAELQSLMRSSYAVFCLKTKTRNNE